MVFIIQVLFMESLARKHALLLRCHFASYSALLIWRVFDMPAIKHSPYVTFEGQLPSKNKSQDLHYTGNIHATRSPEYFSGAEQVEPSPNSIHPAMRQRNEETPIQT